MLPSTFNAATASDLIAAINAANTAGGANTIVLTAPTISPYVLTTVNNTTNGANGLPVISGGARKLAADNLTIVGNGEMIERSTAAGTPAFRLFDVANGGSLNIQNLTLTNGLANGVSVSAEGGAICNQGTLVLSAVLMQNNVAEGAWGPSPTKKIPAAPGYDAAGGAIWSSGSLTTENATIIQYNSAVGGQSNSPGRGGTAGGGAIYVAGGSANITGTSFSFNTSQGGTASYFTNSVGGWAFGGAMYVAAGTVTLSTDSLGAPAGPNYGVSENAALGGADPKGLLQYGNGDGGALYVAGGSVTLTSDYIIANIAEGYEAPGSYTGGIYIASGTTVAIDSFTVNGTYWNATINEVDQTSPYDAQIVGTYSLLP